MQKKKILMISDHPLSTSGVGTQARFLINGLIKTGKYQFRCLGAALKHVNYDTIVVNEDFIVKPIDGFGTQDMIRLAIATEKPDAMLIFTDPRFFVWLWEMEDEIHQCCPIVYWHVWDNDPYPDFNNVLYDSNDLINCLSYKTYGLVKPHFPDKTNYIPHALPTDIYYPLPKDAIERAKIQLLGEKRKDHFTGFWINRNARRKMPNDVLVSWKLFLDELQKKHGHRNATLVMHTDPLDQEGPNLLRTTEHLGITDSIFFSTDRLEFEKINVLHNIADFCLNMACNEGFGLGTLESMQCGKPIIALKTGGLTRQVVNCHDGSENGVALDPDCRDLVGSQNVPYIYEDHVANEKVAAAIMKLYELGSEKRNEIGMKAREYALNEFPINKMVSEWDRTLSETIQNWKKRYSRFCVKSF